MVFPWGQPIRHLLFKEIDAEKTQSVMASVGLHVSLGGISVIIHSFLSIWILSYKWSKKTRTQKTMEEFAPYRNFSEISTSS